MLVSEKLKAQDSVFIERIMSGAFSDYSMSNVILVDEKFILFHQYLRYSPKSVTIVFSISGANL